MIEVKNRTVRIEGTMPKLMAETLGVVSVLTEKLKEYDEDILEVFVNSLIDVAYLGKEEAAKRSTEALNEAKKTLKAMIADLFGGDSDGSEDDNAEGQE